MTPLTLALVSTAAVYGVVFLQHLILGWRVEDRKSQLPFAIAAAAVSGDAVFEQRLIEARSAAEFRSWMPWTALFNAATIDSPGGGDRLHEGVQSEDRSIRPFVAVLFTF